MCNGIAKSSRRVLLHIQKAWQFPDIKGFTGDHWKMRILLLLFPRSYSIYSEIPFLLIYTCNQYWMQNLPSLEIFKAMYLACTRKLEFIKFLGLPVSRSAIDILKRIDTLGAGIFDLLFLSEILYDHRKLVLLREIEGPISTDAVDMISHRPVPHPQIWRIMLRDGFRGECRRQGVCEYWWDIRMSFISFEIHKNIPENQLKSWIKRAGKITTLKGLKKLYEELPKEKRHEVWTLNFDCKSESEISRVAYVDAPFTGNTEISPLCNENELKAHGKRLKNCAASLWYRAADGEFFLYEVHCGCKIASLGIARIGVSGKWVIEDLKGIKNRKPAGAIKRCVKHWWKQRDGNRVEFANDSERVHYLGETEG